MSALAIPHMLLLASVVDIQKTMSTDETESGIDPRKQFENDPATWLDDHGDYLYRYAYTRLGSKAKAEDALQETFLAAMKAKERYDGSSPVRYWLRGILRHKIVDTYRKGSREVIVEDAEAAEIYQTNSFKYGGMVTRKSPDWHFNPRKAFEQKEFSGVLQDCVSALKGPAKDVFVLSELEGWTTEAVADHLGIKPNYVWVLLHRARTQLRTCIGSKWTRDSGAEGNHAEM